MNLKEMSLIFLAIVALTFSGQAQDNYKQINISDDLSLIRISSHAYVHVSYGDIPGFGRAGSNGVVFINNGEAFLFDTPISDELTRTLVMWLSDSMKVRVTGFAPNHWHIDCMGGLAWLKSQGIRSYANQKTIEIAKSKSLPVPDEGFTDSLTIMLGDREICLYYFGPAHSMDNIVAWIPSEKLLFPGCMVKSVDARNLGNTADGDVVAYPVTIKKVIGKFPDVKFVIPGHGSFGGAELLNHTADMAGNR